MPDSVIPKLRHILVGGRGKPSASDAAKAALALAVLTGLAQVIEPAPARAEVSSAPSAQARVARAITPHRPDAALAAAFESALGNDVKDAALLRAILAERIAAKRVVVEAMRAGLSTEVPDAGTAPSPRGEGVPLRDVRPYEDAVDASYERAVAADPAHADLLKAVKAQRDASVEADHQADLIAGVEDEPEAPALR